jgi:TolB-like protein
MSSRSLRSGVRAIAEKRKVLHQLPKRRGAKPLEVPAAASTSPLWPCLLSSIAVGVVPVRNLTGDADRQSLVDAFTESMVSHLHRHGRGFSLRRMAPEPAATDNCIEAAELKAGYLVTGSAQRGNPGMLRVNVRITDAATSEYLWARRYEFSLEEPAPAQAQIIRRISRELHILLLQHEIRRASLASGPEPELDQCLFSAATALEGGLRAEFTAEAQRWFLAALAGDQRNVEALVGLARTCQD